MTTSITLRSTKGSALTHDEMDTNLTNLQTTADDALAATDTLTADKAEAAALGVANTDQNMGSFTGSTISDNVSAKAAIQALETAVETKANASAVGVTASAANMGTYTGATIPDNETAKQNIQSLETALEVVDDNLDDAVAASGIALGAQNYGTFTGATISDNQTAKQALQALETAVELRPAFRSTNITVTVGAGGDYATINEALAYLSKLYPIFVEEGFAAEISLLTGFEMAEQVILNGVDLSWIVITSVDATVAIDRDAITAVAYMDRQPVFAGLENAKLPVLGCQFEVGAGTETKVDGLLVVNGSSCTVRPGSGIRAADRGIHAINGAFVNFVEPGPGRIWDDRPDFTQATEHGIYCAFGCTVNIVGGDFSDSDDIAVYCLSGCIVNAQRVKATGSGGDHAMVSRDGSIVNARASDVSGAAGNGYYALHGGFINARYFDDVGSSGASNCGANGVRAEQGGIIEAEDIIATDCGDAGVYASYGSTINAQGGDFSACATGIWAEYSSRISATNGNVDGCVTGVLCTHASGVDFNSGSGVGCTANAISATGAVQVRAASAILTGAGDTGVLAQDGAIVDINGADVSGATGVGVNCRRGGKVSATNVNARRSVGVDGALDFVISAGGIITADGATGGFNTAPNTLSRSGIIVSDRGNSLTHPGYVAGNWYLPVRGTVAGGAAMPGSSIAFLPFQLEAPITISDLGARVSTAAAGGNAQFAIYANDPADNRPTGSALAATGNVSVASTGPISADVTGANVILEPGTYWMAVNTDNATAAFTTLSQGWVNASYLVGSATQANIASASGTAQLGFTLAQTFGTWPDVTASSFTEIGTAASAIVHLKAA